MRSLIFAVVLAAILVFVALWFGNVWRESRLLRISGLDLSRYEVTLEKKSNQSINFGADDRSSFLFRLPDDFEGLAHCNANGYSSIRSADDTEFDINETQSCSKEVVSKDGTVYIFIVFSKQLYVKVLA